MCGAFPLITEANMKPVECTAGPDFKKLYKNKTLQASVNISLSYHVFAPCNIT